MPPRRPGAATRAQSDEARGYEQIVPSQSAPPRVGGGVTLKLAVAATRLPPAGAVVRAFTAICVA